MPSALLLIVLVLAVNASSSSAEVRNGPGDRRVMSAARPVIWRDPGNIESRDLRYGPGAPSRIPRAPFVFLEEYTSGTSPKFRVKDSRNVEWIVKLGPEAQAETVATRLLWAAGYFADETYYLPRVRIHHL